eukprot:g794.t1
MTYDSNVQNNRKKKKKTENEHAKSAMSTSMNNKPDKNKKRKRPMGIPKKKKMKKKKTKKDNNAAQWEKQDKNAPITKLHFSGFPSNSNAITLENLHTFFRKCGVLKKHVDTTSPLRLPNIAYNRTNGSGTVQYLQPASIELAMTILDESDQLLSNYPIKLSLANTNQWFGENEPFTVSEQQVESSKTSSQNEKEQHKGTKLGSQKQRTNGNVMKNGKTSDKKTSQPPNAGLTQPLNSRLSFISSTRVLSNEQKVAQRVVQLEEEQALSWDESNSQGLCIVVLKHMFHPSEFTGPDSDEFAEDLREDIAEECAKVGTLSKMTFFEKHPEGIVVLKFSTTLGAEQCIKLMNGRSFAKRRIVADYWDGFTDYTKEKYVEEASDKTTGEMTEEARIDAFGDWLES